MQGDAMTTQTTPEAPSLQITLAKLLAGEFGAARAASASRQAGHLLYRNLCRWSGQDWGDYYALPDADRNALIEGAVSCPLQPDGNRPGTSGCAIINGESVPLVPREVVTD